MIRSREQVLILHAAHERGETLAQIAEQEGVSPQRINQIFKQHQLPTRERGSRSTELRAKHLVQIKERREEIIRLYKALGTVNRVADQVELPYDMVAEVISTIPNREAYRRRGAYVMRSKDALRRDLQTAKEMCGEPLTIPAYRGVAKELGLASYNTQIRAFGSWSAALSAAGIKANESRGARASSITEQDCIAAVAEFYKELGKRPSYDGYREWARDKNVPSGPSIRLKIGSWNRAVSLVMDSDV